MEFNALSLFASAGIAETYLHKHGVHVCVAAELLPERVRFYQHMYPDTVAIQGDLTEESVYESVLSAARTAQCDFLIATPPCQGMSTAGKQLKDDPRNRLITVVANAIESLKPKFALIETSLKCCKQRSW